MPALSDLLTADQATLRQTLLNQIATDAYKEGDFTLSSGQKSTYYINGKLVTLTPMGALLIGRLILAQLDQDVAAVAGLTLGADPIVSAVSVVSAYENCPIPALIIRKKAKGHGTQAYIEGPSLTPGAKVVVLEDVVTTGQSAAQAVERLRDAGYQVEEIIALVDRQQGGAEFYASQNLKFSSLFTITEVQAAYRALNA
ncbi:MULTISPECIES: orotate phosphoribosyltransferase [Cyanophyceae]|uniref:orotate phosphoribosyltransferase n=1 Tax=Cyanophyceae TaxID=3028117 RepID=UPI00016DC409|nr:MULTISPECIES: orotate phosphoribosyltransferase [Cyanophyceae]ACA99205.1 orotate phosphoribosyltransferase [Picosynechococcus sp. PCC 7002]AMA08935.1 orotate phosphoribosyltransferase [Picosynechococcus sp. PCC 73109]ANV90229.1 orotate phosphoribosyltransferase [Picosynechococcus sp. PCC 8807]SMH33833.1 orotate phosphoribosyltransferase [Picosynechococcus sp. OG1]SMQ84476.1 orotate phosphoribosyltransferase [Synechococcus sp. 7002]